MICERISENVFGKRFIHIGLEHVSVAAARVVELPPRCSNKGGQSVYVYTTHARIICSPPPRRALLGVLHQPLMRQNPLEQALFWENKRTENLQVRK